MSMNGASRTIAKNWCSQPAACPWSRRSWPAMSGKNIPRNGRRAMAEGRELRIAAVGDLHYDAGVTATNFRDMFADVNKRADILVLCGDMTTHGKPEQMKAL